MFLSNGSGQRVRAQMNSHLWTKTICCLLLSAGLFLSAPTRAVAPAPLPAFSVQGLDGTSVPSSSFSLKGKSLLIYVEGNCQSCATLLGRLLQKDYPQLALHATIIVGGAGPLGAKALQQLYPD